MIACFMLLLTPFIQARAQCTGTIESISDTLTFISNGKTVIPATFPKFDANKGTLLSVNLQALVTLTYNFSIENRTATAGNPRLRVNYEVELYSTSSFVSPVYEYRLATSPNPPSYYGPYALAGTDGVTGSGPDYYAGALPVYSTDFVFFNKTYSNTADYLGVGTVSFEYSPTTSPLLNNTPDDYAYTSSTSERIKIVLTYTYCNTNTALAENIKAFTVTKKSDEQVDTRWFTTNETPGRIYTLQKSKDGSVFTPIKDFASVADNNQTGDYQYSYKPVNETGKLYFRVKQKDADGGISYSPVRSVEIGSTVINNRSLTLYPNPTANSATLLFGTQPGNWSVDIISLPGQVIRKLQFKNAVKADLNGDRSLSSGVYFLKITDQQTQRQYTQRLIVQ